MHDPTAPHATPDEGEARKRRHIESFTPPTRPEIASSAAAASATRTTAGPALHDAKTVAEADDSEARKRARRSERLAPPTPYEIGTLGKPEPGRLAQEGLEPGGGTDSDRDTHAQCVEVTRDPQPRKRRLCDAEASTAPAHGAQSALRAEAPLQAPQRGPAAEGATDSDEARKRARRIDRFAPPTPYEIAMAAATATAARMAAGRAHDWSARDLPTDEQGVASHTRSVALAVPSTQRTQVGKATSNTEPAAVPNRSNTPTASATGVARGVRGNAESAIAAPTPGMPRNRAIRATSMPVPAGEPAATKVPDEGSATATEERVANGTRAVAAPTPGTLHRQAIKAASLPAPAAEPKATKVPKGGSPTVAEEGVTGDLRASVAPSPGDPMGCADTAAPITTTSPAADPDGSSAIRATSMPVPAGEPAATKVPDGGSATATEERVANGTCAVAAPPPGTLYRQAIKAASLPAPAAEPKATKVPKGGSPTVAEEGVTGDLRASDAPSPDDPMGCADTAAPITMASPATDPDGSSTPKVTTEWLSVATRDAAILLIPVAHHPSVGACAMISLRQPQELFGAVRDAHRVAAAQSAELATGISQGLETVYAATVTCFGKPDVVVMVPWATPPACVLTSTTQRAEAAANGQRTAWCTLDALDGHIASFPVGAAFLRIAALTTVGAHGAQNAGKWASSRPMVRARTAHTLASTETPLLTPEALEQQRAAFFTLEAARGTEIRALLVAADPGTGELIAMADKVMTAADYRMELPFPVNGLPDFSCDSLRTLPYVERPLQLSTSWLARLPPQQVPPGSSPRPWTGILRPWARRACCASLNQTAERDFECLAAGASTRRRPEYLCIGPGGGKMIQHADGIGSYNALSIVWELDTQTGLYGPLDFARPGRTHWVLNMLRQLLGEHEDQQLMSLVMDGVRWGVQAPMQIRIAANLERLDERVRGVGEAFAKLLKKGLYYKYRQLRRVNETIDPNGPGPFITIPVYIVGTGGTDKPDNPNEKRIVGDQGCPHPEQALRERNKPHGAPDGPLIVSLNDMMGPTPGSVPRGQPLDPQRYPMPDPESKPRPRHSYRNGAILNHMAHVNKTYVAGFKDDGRHMFFQFEQSPEEERTCAFIVVIPFPLLSHDGLPILNDDGTAQTELWFTLVIGTCMNMGSRNASKIAQRFTDRILEGFSRLLDAYVRDTWMPKQTPELQTLLAERAATLGPRQARPFDTSGYTDDYKLMFVGPELLAAGARIWRTACRECNYWLSEKACAGTVLDYIGGRLVLNGGFGCISPSKRARAIADSEAAIGGRLTREQLESHNSFLVHVHEWLDFPMGTLKGLSAPLKLPGSPDQRATLSDRVRAQHRRIIELLQTRHAASFWSGVDEAARIGGSEDGAGFEAVIFAPRITSDACSDVEHPHICGVCNGLYHAHGGVRHHPRADHLRQVFPPRRAARRKRRDGLPCYGGGRRRGGRSNLHTAARRADWRLPGGYATRLAPTLQGLGQRALGRGIARQDVGDVLDGGSDGHPAARGSHPRRRAHIHAGRPRQHVRGGPRARRARHVPRDAQSQHVRRHADCSPPDDRAPPRARRDAAHRGT